ncbi:MAG: PP0621 family protein [Gammaproteobacteria bacterium]
MGLRALIILALIGLAYWWFKNRFLTHRDTPPTDRHQAPPTDPDDPERMVKCRVCGLHVPQSRAISRDGRFYCGTEHLEQDQG